MTSAEPPTTDPWDLGDNASISPASAEPSSSPAVAAAAAAAAGGLTHESAAGVVFIGCFLVFLIFLSIAGNVLVCLAIYTERGLRRVGNLFLASLAIADLFVAALVMSLAAFNDLLGYWLFGPQLCDTWIAFDVMCSTASILNLCAISLDRYINIKDPLRYDLWVTRRVVGGTICGVWLLAALISFLPISLGLHRPPEPPPQEPGKMPSCALDLAPTYAVVSSCISFYVPCVVMLGIYCRLYCYAQKHVKSIRAVTPVAGSSPGCVVGGTGMTQPPHLQQSYRVSDHKAAITVGVIMGVFLVCWVPFFCVNIVAAYCKTCIPDYAFKVLTWLGYSNSAFNPIIYSIFNTEFRNAFRRILTARCAGYESVSTRNDNAALARKKAKASAAAAAAALSVNTPRRNGSATHLRDYAVSPRSSAGSLRHTRVNSCEQLDGEEVSAI